MIVIEKNDKSPKLCIITERYKHLFFVLIYKKEYKKYLYPIIDNVMLYQYHAIVDNVPICWHHIIMGCNCIMGMPHGNGKQQG